jgi:hypothetical protein
MRFTRKLLCLGALVSLAGGCDCALKGEKVINPPGIYECQPKAGHQGPTYKFDSTDKRTAVWVGSQEGIQFFDQNSQENVRLFNNSNVKYECECVEPRRQK